MKPTYFIHCGEDGKYKVTKELVSDPITLFSKRNGLYVAENINLLEVACLIVCLYDQTPLKTSSNINFFAIGCPKLGFSFNLSITLFILFFNMSLSDRLLNSFSSSSFANTTLTLFCIINNEDYINKIF